jgi:hypothetical protein
MESAECGASENAIFVVIFKPENIFDVYVTFVSPYKTRPIIFQFYV